MKALLFFVGLSTLAIAGVQTPSSQQPVTYTETIKPLIDRKCLSCHVKGGAAPFPLQTYAQVKKRAELCERMMLTRMMPPSNARWDSGEFSLGGGPLTDEEAVLLQRWMQQGAPEGSASEPAKIPDLRAWTLGKPDAVLTPTQSFTIPEEGRPFWQAFVLPLKSLQGRRIRGFEIRVDQPQALRSAVVAVARDGLLGTRRAVEGFTTGGSLDFDAKKYVGTWAAGYPVWELPPGVAMTLNGDALVVQALYLPRGKSESGNFELALYFSKDKSAVEPEWTLIGQEDFTVPAPGSLILTPSAQLPPNSELVAVLPEARFFCTSIRLKMGEEFVFATRRWEPYWQGVYRFPEPIKVPDGTTLETEFNYDNDIHMGRNEGRRPRPILPGYRERDELCRLHVLSFRRK